ncbi:unnamed protein product, partial [marine sediment metagenome]
MTKFSLETYFGDFIPQSSAIPAKCPLCSESLMFFYRSSLFDHEFLYCYKCSV